MFAIFEKLKKEDIKTHEFTDTDKAILISTLLIECARSDDNFSDIEKEQIKKILKNKLHLDSSEVEKCFETANESSEKSIEIYSLTKEIRDNFNKEEILFIFELLWKIILSDGIIDDFESSMMTKLTGLFHLTGKENAEARKNAQMALNP
tara:strand:- start:197 stop:646 length:450 start_codon:yes stop_codon:yes gene_type:complete